MLTDIKTQKSDRFLGHLAAGLLLSVLATGINVVKRDATNLAKNSKTILWIKKCIDSRKIGEFFGSVPIPLIEVGLSLMKNTNAIGKKCFNTSKINSSRFNYSKENS